MSRHSHEAQQRQSLFGEGQIYPNDEVKSRVSLGFAEKVRLGVLATSCIAVRTQPMRDREGVSDFEKKGKMVRLEDQLTPATV